MKTKKNSQDNEIKLRMIPLFNPRFWMRQAQNGVSLMSANGGKRFSLNESGSYVLSLCDGTTTIDEILKDFYMNFKIRSKEEAQNDLLFFIDRLLENGIIQFVSMRNKNE